MANGKPMLNVNMNTNMNGDAKHVKAGKDVPKGPMNHVIGGKGKDAPNGFRRHLNGVRKISVVREEYFEES